MRIGINRIGAVENMSFEGVPPPEITDLDQRLKREVEKLRQFQHVINLLIALEDIEAFEVRLKGKNGNQDNYLIFSDSVPETAKAQKEELKRLLGLSSHQNTFRITSRVTDIKDEELSIQTRSLTAMMAFLAKGIQVPPEHLASGIAIDYQIPISEKLEKDLIPFRMFTSENQPENPFAAVRYLDHWYYIDNKDLESKRAIGLVINLFRTLAPSGGMATPVLTVPAG
jgi:hypothetical protein